MAIPVGKKETTRMNDPFYRMTRMVLLATVGAVSLAQDEMKAFLDRLVERGEIAETDARSLVKEVVERREKLEHERRAVKPAAKKAEGATKADIDALNARIADLTRQIEALRAQQK